MKDTTNNAIGILIWGSQYKNRLECLLREKYVVISRNSVEELVAVMSGKLLYCIVIYFNGNYMFSLSNILQMKKQFSSIPIIGIIEKEDMELARLCGLNGFDKLVSAKDIGLIDTIILEVSKKFRSRITLCDFRIELDNLSDLMVRALKLIEAHYTELKGVGEIAASLGVNESTLSREFRQYNLVGPKRILLYFKLKYAIRLMQNEGLSLKDITYLSGFSSAKRFNECFHLVFDCSPGNYRTDNIFSIQEQDETSKLIYQSWKV